LGIRENNQTPDTGGRASYLKQEEKVSDFFKIKQEMTRQDIKQNRNRDSLMLDINFIVTFDEVFCNFAWARITILETGNLV